jgi:hypothetical protein
MVKLTVSLQKMEEVCEVNQFFMLEPIFNPLLCFLSITLNSMYGKSVILFII